MKFFSTDHILRMADLRKRLVHWRVLAIVFGFFAITMLILATSDNQIKSTAVGGDYIARVEIKDIIVSDRDRAQALLDLSKNARVKAVLVHVNSPGGTIVGGETLYNSIRAISAQKPVVAVMGSVAASGGYMASVAADHIVAHNGTITGSIGVMLQSFDVVGLANKLGIHLVSFKSSPLKGAPSPFEKISPEAAKVIQSGVDDAYDLFVDMVASRRSMLSKEQVQLLANGQVYTGRQALEKKLIDALGNEKDALTWLQTQKDIDNSLPIRDISLDNSRDGLRGLLNSAINTFIPGYGVAAIEPGAILALWAAGV